MLPFEEAVTTAAHKLLSEARLPEGAGAPPFALVIDPLIDGVTGDQSNATRSMGDLIEKLVRDLRVHQILEGTNEIMRVIIARHLIGR